MGEVTAYCPANIPGNKKISKRGSGRFCQAYFSLNISGLLRERKLTESTRKKEVRHSPYFTFPSQYGGSHVDGRFNKLGAEALSKYACFLFQVLLSETESHNCLACRSVQCFTVSSISAEQPQTLHLQRPEHTLAAAAHERA